MNQSNQQNGYIHLYTGNGKGKTTAAIGLAVRAAGANKTIFIGQFVKGMHYAELVSLQRIPQIKVKQFGLDCFIVNNPTQKDVDAARAGFDEISGIMLNNSYNMVILDEICIAIYYRLIGVNEVIDVLGKKPREMEVILTGRYAPQELIDIADLVTEMKEIKHYYNQGIEARKGIEY
ncbi:MAG TPA: cob(I)yrinic acid a,c-diamide adenosyltransferase [Tenuifilaceae bacterium]|nr:cob(I)yrinic acid a,c-diamide adenosyltransferase [Tenuifilaceae bacterium]